MELETSGAEAPAGGEAVADATTVVNPDATTGQQSDADNDGAASTADDTGAQTGDEAAAAARKKPGISGRFQELTRQKHDALRDAEYWRTKAQELESKLTTDLDYDDQLVVKMRKESASERAEAADMVAKQAVVQQFAVLEQEARAKWADYEQVAYGQNHTVTNEMAGLITESDVGPDVAYHLGKNPQEAARLAQMSGKQLAKEIGRLEAKLTAPKALPKQPPAPVQPVSAIAAGGTKDPGSMSMAEYVAARNAGKI